MPGNLGGRARARAVPALRTGLGRPCTRATWPGVTATRGAPATKPGARTGSQNLGSSPSNPRLTTGRAADRQASQNSFMKSLYKQQQNHRDGETRASTSSVKCLVLK